MTPKDGEQDVVERAVKWAEELERGRNRGIRYSTSKLLREAAAEIRRLRALLFKMADIIEEAQRVYFNNGEMEAAVLLADAKVAIATVLEAAGVESPE